MTNDLFNPDDSFPAFDDVGSCMGTEDEGNCPHCKAKQAKPEFVNPIIVLAGATANSGHAMFAEDLLNVGRGHRDCKAIRRRTTRLAGMSDVCIAKCVEHSLISTGSASLKRPRLLGYGFSSVSSIVVIGA